MRYGLRYGDRSVTVVTVTKKRYGSEAERQKAYRERRKAKREAAEKKAAENPVHRMVEGSVSLPPDVVEAVKTAAEADSQPTEPHEPLPARVESSTVPASEPGDSPPGEATSTSASQPVSAPAAMSTDIADSPQDGQAGAEGSGAATAVVGPSAAPVPPDVTKAAAARMAKAEIQAWADHVRGVLHAAAIAGANEESERRRLNAMSSPPAKGDEVFDTGSEKVGPKKGGPSWAMLRRQRAVRYAEFMLKNRATDPQYFGFFEHGLPPRSVNGVPTTNEMIEGFYGYYRRSPGHGYPGIADLPA